MYIGGNENFWIYVGYGSLIILLKYNACSSCKTRVSKSDKHQYLHIHVYGFMGKLDTGYEYGTLHSE